MHILKIFKIKKKIRIMKILWIETDCIVYTLCISSSKTCKNNRMSFSYNSSDFRYSDCYYSSDCHHDSSKVSWHLFSNIFRKSISMKNTLQRSWTVFNIFIIYYYFCVKNGDWFNFNGSIFYREMKAKLFLVISNNWLTFLLRKRDMFFPAIVALATTFNFYFLRF